MMMMMMMTRTLSWDRSRYICKYLKILRGTFGAERRGAFGHLGAWFCSDLHKGFKNIKKNSLVSVCFAVIFQLVDFSLILAHLEIGGALCYKTLQIHPSCTGLNSYLICSRTSHTVFKFSSFWVVAFISNSSIFLFTGVKTWSSTTML